MSTPMSRLDTRVIVSSGRTSGMHFWPHYLLAGLLIGLGLSAAGVVSGRPAEGPEPAAWAAVLLGLVLLARSLAIVLFGARWWVTREQVVQSDGVISRQTREISIDELVEVEVLHGPLGRLLGLGSVRLTGRAGRASADGSEASVTLSGVRSPATVAAAIRRLRDRGRGHS